MGIRRPSSRPEAGAREGEQREGEIAHLIDGGEVLLDSVFGDLTEVGGEDLDGSVQEIEDKERLRLRLPRDSASAQQADATQRTHLHDREEEEAPVLNVHKDEFAVGNDGQHLLVGRRLAHCARIDVSYLTELHRERTIAPEVVHNSSREETPPVLLDDDIPAGGDTLMSGRPRSRLQERTERGSEACSRTPMGSR